MIVKLGVERDRMKRADCHGQPRLCVFASALWQRALNRLPYRLHPQRSITSGFTAAEMLVTTAIAAVVLGAAALAFSTVARGQRQFTQTATVRLPSGVLTNFYGGSGTTTAAYIAPNFGSVARAESLREIFLADCSQSVAVYCLSRAGGTWNTYRPTSIPAPDNGVVLDTPEAFRSWLATAVVSTASLYRSYRNVEAQPTSLSTTPGFTIFILGYSANATTIPVLAVYDLDLVQATDVNSTGTVIGTYAAVRRYVSGTLTAYYDVVYPTATVVAGQAESWTPSIVAFERRSRLAVAEGATTHDRFKVAAEQPFYFIFWPDPARDSLAVPINAYTLNGGAYVLNFDYTTADPRRTYNHMAGRTSFMFTIPMFPSS